jgi:hypothetical protein
MNTELVSDNAKEFNISEYSGKLDKYMRAEGKRVDKLVIRSSVLRVLQEDHYTVYAWFVLKLDLR